MSETNNGVQAFIPPKIDVTVSADKMLAYIRVKLSNKEQQVTKQDILSAMSLKNIKYGILSEEITRFCDSKNYYSDLTVAKGLQPVKGKDGSVEMHFREKVSNNAIEREDGTLDFKNLDIIQNVKKGDKLCTVTFPSEGSPGIDVLGNPVKAAKGNMPVIPRGDKVRISEDSRFVYADADGGISYRNGVIIIEEVYTVKDDVCLSSGNINFNGSVIINGNVIEGFSVTAEKDITVNGIVEGAALNAGGSVLIKNGVNGMRKAVITAGENVTSSFIENAVVNCGGDLLSDVILNGDVNAGGSIILRGRKGAVIGGKYRAGEKINAKVIGNNANTSQELIIDPRWYELEKRGKSEAHETSFEKKHVLMSQRKTLTDYLEKDAILEKTESTQLSNDEIKKKMRERLQKNASIKQGISQIDDEIKEIERLWNERDFKIICLEEAFPGTKIVIGNAAMKVNTLIQNQKFYLNEGEVTVGTILPHEREG